MNGGAPAEIFWPPNLEARLRSLRGAGLRRSPYLDASRWPSHFLDSLMLLVLKAT